MISTRGRYAIRVMIDLAENGQGRAVPLKDIAVRQEISKKYLEIIVRDLVAGGLIAGTGGKGGGYRLCRRPEDYTLEEILERAEGTLSPVACLAGPENTCPRRAACRTLPMWTGFDALIRGFFRGKRLSDLTAPEGGHPLLLKKLPDALSVCKLPGTADPGLRGGLCFIARTDAEVSLVCRTADAPADALAREDGWLAFRAEGSLDFALTGILAGLSGVLAAEGIPIFAVSTFDTDYILVKAEHFARAEAALRRAGYGFLPEAE